MGRAATNEHFECPHRLDDSCAIGIRLKNRERFEIPERGMIGLCEIYHVLRAGGQSFRGNLQEIEKTQ